MAKDLMVLLEDQLATNIQVVVVRVELAVQE
jgi:hypothetical protein